jgi:L-serine dehydratase
MQSLKYLFKIGRGPSSSHTMGPYFAAKKIVKRFPQANKFHVTLFNSLALTGEGHLTYEVIKETLQNHQVDFSSKIDVNKHPNTLIFAIYQDDNKLEEVEVRSIGGGQILFEGETIEEISIYPHQHFDDIKAFCEQNNLTFYQYIKSIEGEDIDVFLTKVWNQMKASIEEGLNKEGVLPGKLQVKRKARDLFFKQSENESHSLRENRLVSAYAFAVNEVNASGGFIVTSPTCGAAGTLPAVLYYMYKNENVPEDKIIEALATAGLIGNIIKHNATISGAVGGCQAEVGSACSMAAAAHALIVANNFEQIECAAEIALEHTLGLTCDPIDGYVQIPCIERNAVAAIRAMTSSRISYFLSGSRKISFDMIVQTMYQTGLDMHPKYKETAEAGMAYFYRGYNKK